MSMRKVLLALIAALVGMTAVPAAPVDAAPNLIVAANGLFAPAEVVVAAGTGLTFVNLDPGSHDVVAVHGEFASAQIGRGATKVVGVESLAPDTYSFVCTVHPDDMWGNLTVV